MLLPVLPAGGRSCVRKHSGSTQQTLDVGANNATISTDGAGARRRLLLLDARMTSFAPGGVL